MMTSRWLFRHSVCDSECVCKDICNNTNFDVAGITGNVIYPEIKTAIMTLKEHNRTNRVGKTKTLL